MTSLAQQEYDALVAGLRQYAPYDPASGQPRTDLGGWNMKANAPGPGPDARPILEWDVYQLDRQLLDSTDPNIVTGVESHVWVSIQTQISTKEKSGGVLIDRHWPVADVQITGDPTRVSFHYATQPEPVPVPDVASKADPSATQPAASKPKP